MSPNAPNIAIISAGLSGLTLALTLNAKCPHVTTFVCESRPLTNTHSGSMVLTSNALRVLDCVGIYTRLRSIGSVHDGVDFVNVKGDALGWLVLGDEEQYGYPAL